MGFCDTGVPPARDPSSPGTCQSMESAHSNCYNCTQLVLFVEHKIGTCLGETRIQVPGTDEQTHEKVHHCYGSKPCALMCTTGLWSNGRYAPLELHVCGRERKAARSADCFESSSLAFQNFPPKKKSHKRCVTVALALVHDRTRPTYTGAVTLVWIYVDTSSNLCIQKRARFNNVTAYA